MHAHVTHETPLRHYVDTTGGNIYISRDITRYIHYVTPRDKICHETLRNCETDTVIHQKTLRNITRFLNAMLIFQN